MKQFTLRLLAFVLIIGGAVAVFWPVNFTRLFDANMQPLALSEVESYCVGFVGLTSSFKTDDKDVTACRTEYAVLGSVADVANAPRWFCTGLVSGGWDGTTEQCIDILDGNELWPLLNGGITAEWNDAHPRPSIPSQVIVDPGRSDNLRDDSTNRGNTIETP